MIDLEKRAALYEELAYYEARATKALAAGDMRAFEKWASKYHALKFLLD